jgi:hypothetical protein
MQVVASKEGRMGLPQDAKDFCIAERGHRNKKEDASSSSPPSDQRLKLPGIMMNPRDKVFFS